MGQDKGWMQRVTALLERWDVKKGAVTVKSQREIAVILDLFEDGSHYCGE